ncbi:hypothetical protein [Stenotrophomonas sp.]|uniref:hypothetical protein n=1 Tax=Stenotrophomonas sp. TaxID=69392 RepID=UPI0028972C04|nr:hypothetical protein [Stenotrophomonas sp.]
MKLGIDVGRVLISPGDDSTPDTSFIAGSLENALNTPPMDDMFQVVPALVERFAGEVWIVSKCGQRIQDRTMQWFEHHRFFERTGIGRANVRFCLQRPEKAVHCRALGITHFIDDRTDVLQAMEEVVSHRYLFGPQRKAVPQGMQHVMTWKDVARTLL